MGKPTHTLADPDKRRSRPGAPLISLAGAPLPLQPGVPMQSAAGNLALQSLFSPQLLFTPQPNSSSAEWSFDPYAEDLATFTNGELVDAVLYTDDWLLENGVVHLDHEAYRIRQARLEGECQRRIRMGHMWLGFAHARQSFPLYQTIAGKDGAFDVVALENDELAHGPASDLSDRPIMTEGQLQGSLDANDVPAVNAADFQAAILAELMADYSFEDTGLAPVEGLSGAVSQSSVRPNLLQDAFALTNPMARQGALAEVYFGTSRPAGYGFGAYDYNAQPWLHPTRGIELGNFPVVDYRTLLGGAMPESSVKSSTVANADPFRSYATYLRGFAEMMNTEPDYRGFDHYMANAARGRSAGQVRDQLSLIINADDVADFQRFLLDPFGHQTTPGGSQSRSPNYQRAAMMRIYDGILQDRPLVLPDGTTLNSVAALDAALGNNTINATQHRTALTDAAQRAAAKVAPNPDLTRATLARFAAARGAVPNTMTARDVRAALSPEYMHSLAHGGGARGDFHAMRSYGGRGAGLGALFGMGYEYFSGDQSRPDAFERMLRAGGREGLRGGATSSMEALAASRASRYILARGLTQSSGRALGARLGARAVPGGVVDVGFAGYDMLTDARANRPAEVGYRLGRAFVIGASSALAGATAGAWAGAAIGTAIFPGVGTVVGFVVGVLVGAIVGFIMNALIPDYEEMVMEQVPLKEFEKNIQAQSAGSIQNQVLAAQELELLMQVSRGPKTRGPHLMADVLRHRNLSTSPGDRMADEAMLLDRVHGGCMECHTKKGAADYDAQFPAFHEARMRPVDRLMFAAMEESGGVGARPKFLGRYDMPGETVPEALWEDMGSDPTTAMMLASIDVIQPNFKAWAQAAPESAGVIPTGSVMNSPKDAAALKAEIQRNINRRQWWFELWFGEAGEAEYKIYEDALKKAQEEQEKKGK